MSDEGKRRVVAANRGQPQCFTALISRECAACCSGELYAAQVPFILLV